MIALATLSVFGVGAVQAEEVGDPGFPEVPEGSTIETSVIEVNSDWVAMSKGHPNMESKSWLDLNVSFNGIAESGKPFNLNKTFDNSALAALRAKEGFDQFGLDRSDDPVEKDLWSLVSGLHLSGTADKPAGGENSNKNVPHTASYNSLDLTLNTTADGFYDTVGVFLGGNGNFTVGSGLEEEETSGHAKITVTSSQNGLVGSDSTGSITAGLMLESDEPDMDGQAVVHFGTNTTDINVTALGQNMHAVGVFTESTTYNPVIEFVGSETTIDVKGNDVAVGVYVAQDDWSDEPWQPPVVDPDPNPDEQEFTGETPSKLSSTVGLKSDKTTITVDGGKASVGLLVMGDATVNVGGALTVTAMGQGQHALAIGSHADILASDIDEDVIALIENDSGNPQTTKTTFHVLDEGSATLNGNVFIGGQAALQLDGSMNVAGSFLSKGVVTGTGTLTVNGALESTGGSLAVGALVVNGSIKVGGPDLETYATDGSIQVSSLTLDGTNAGKSVIDGMLTVEGDATVKGAELENNDTISVTGDFTLTNGTLENNAKLDVNGNLVLGQGAILVDATNAVMNSASLVIGQGSELRTDLTEVEGGYELAFNEKEGNINFAGGKVTDGNGHELSVLTVKKAEQSQELTESDTELVFSAGNYSLNAINIDLTGAQATEATPLSISGGNLTVEAFNAGQGSAEQSAGTFQVGTLTSGGAFTMSAADTGFTVGEFVGQTGGAFTLASGLMNLTTLTLGKDDATGTLTIADGATLKTSIDQIFTSTENPAGVNFLDLTWNKKNGELLVLEDGSTVAFTDTEYTLSLASQAGTLYDGANFAFTGKLVDDNGEEVTEATVDELPSGVHENVDMTIDKGSSSDTATVSKDVGGKTIAAGEGVTKIEVGTDNTLTLVGSSNGGELVSFTEAEGDKSIDVKGNLALGSATNEGVSGKISTAIELSGTSKLKVNNGDFTLASVKAADGTKIDAAAGNLTIAQLDASAGAATVGGTAGSVTLDSVKIADASVINVTGGNATIKAFDTAEINAYSATGPAVNVTAGAFTYTGETLEGVTLTTGTDGSQRKAKADAGIEGAAKTFLPNISVVSTPIAIGNNAVTTIGADVAAFDDVVKALAHTETTWGATSSALFLAKPITVSKTGAINVGGTTATAGQVIFASGSILVADMTAMTGDKALISAAGEEKLTYSIDKAASAILTGTMKEGVEYALTDSTEQKFTADNIKSGNPLFAITVGEDGKIKADAVAVDSLGLDMQGGALAVAGNGDDWVNAILSDQSKSLKDRAAAFDAAMHAAGAMATFTTATDRAIELRQAVRAQGAAESTALWAQITGGKTKLKGISTGAQSLDVDTDAYGLVIGAEAALQNATLGAAFSAGSGKSENDTVDGKDEFDYFGLAFYGRTNVGLVDLVGDVSATWLKSDLTVGGLADVDTDTTTTVWSAGIEARHTFDLGFADVTPFVGADVYHVRADGYSNGHGARVEDANATMVEFPIGTEIAKAFTTAGGMNVKPAFSLAVIPTAGDRDIDSTVKFAGASANYNFTFADDVKVRSTLGVEAAKENFRFGLDLGYVWGNEERSATSLQAKASYLF